MLRIISLLLFNLSISGSVSAQKHDNIWLFGYDYDPGGLKEGIRFQFDDSLKISYEGRAMDFATTSAFLSDSNGNLLIYSNGCYIANSQGEEVENSAGLNPGIMYNIFCADGYGYNIPNGMISVPDPENQNLVHFFHYPLVDNQNPVAKNILHTLVDLSANSGLGSTVFKNKAIVQDTISRDGLHAVKHANGRDWWIIAAKHAVNEYYLIYVGADTIMAKGQITGAGPTTPGSRGEFCFSPDGSKLARFNTVDDLRIFDFDRCSGVLSNPVFIQINNEEDINYYAGLAWSADGRYLYAAEIQHILQFDTWAADIAATQKKVAERPPIPSPSMAYLELGPDGHIYGRSLGGNWCVHRIKYPERGDTACQVEQCYYWLDFPFGNLPHFPNFRLGPIDGSSCDTLGLNNLPLAGWRYDKTGGLSVDFTSVSWYEPVNWWWDFGDPASGVSNQSTARNPAHTFSSPGAYEVCLTVGNANGSDTKCRMLWLETVSTDAAADQDGGYRIYPNPSTGLLQWSGTSGEAVWVRVFDLRGTLVFERQAENARVDLGRLPNGIYFVQLSDMKGSVLTAQKITLQQ
ncbi:MAG: PKD domain-containing protein [Saprospiraceae bacterium]|nr:PKD domain-containing protein [Saprospiraceae bacterium]